MRGPANSLTQKAPYKGLGADSEEKREPASDIDTRVVDGLKVLDPERPIREAAVSNRSNAGLFKHLVGERKQRRRYSQTERPATSRQWYADQHRMGHGKFLAR